MSAVLIELQYLAPIQSYAQFLKYDTVWLEQQEHYTKGSFRNRCHIATATGVLRLSIPLLKGKHQQLPIREAAIDKSTDWQTVHWRSLQTAYGKAPFWLDYADSLRVLYEKNYNWLWDVNWDAQEIIFRLLGIRPNIRLTEQFWEVPPEGIVDFRGRLLPNNYDTPPSSPFRPIVYTQLFADRIAFLPNLSILDLLFCVGNEAKFFLS